MPVDDVAPEILEFIDKYIHRFVCWDILVYFHENPEFERKLSEIAVDVGRRISIIQPTLEEFVKEGILEVASSEEEEEEITYRYCAPANFRKMADDFILATQDRTTRLAIVSRILQKETEMI
ncbi:MAG: hypothetical protein PHO53_00810 [Actinomycetota bacterium]|nr:hypothetical protein [Actinomycetota bacterium]